MTDEVKIDEDREPDLIGTVREETNDEGYFAIWVKVGRALISGYGRTEHVWVQDEWLCVHSSEVKAHGKQVREDHVLGFPVVGAVPNTPAHAQRQIKAAREGMARRLRAVAQAPSHAITPRFIDRRRKRTGV